MTDQEKLSLVRQRIAKLQGVISAPDPVSKAFPLGRVGGSGPNVASLNRKREATLEKVIDAAVTIKKLHIEEQRLVLRLQEHDPEYQARQAAKADTRESTRIKKEAFIRTLAPGDPIESQYGVGTIVRHNRKGATVQYSLFKESIPYIDLWPTKDQMGAALAFSLAASVTHGSQETEGGARPLPVKTYPLSAILDAP